MKLTVQKLDTQFGLFPWHAGMKSRVREYCDDCGAPTNPHTQETECQICFTDERMQDICGCAVGGCFRPDDAFCASNAVGKVIGHATTLFGDKTAREKVYLYTRKRVLAFYQEFVARLGISRALTCDCFDRIVGDGLGDKAECVCWAFPDGVGKNSLSSSLQRHLSGVVLSKIADGKFYRSLVRDLVQFVNRSPIHKNLYPITPLGDCLCHRLPCSCLLKDAAFTDCGWFCNEAFRFMDNGGKCNIQRFYKFLNRLGIATDCGRQVYDNWLADLSMRKVVPELGICQQKYIECVCRCDCGCAMPPFAQQDRGVLFNDFLDRLAGEWCGVAQCNMDYAKLTHQCGTMATEIADISGQFGGYQDDFKRYYNSRMMEELKSSRSLKFHAPVFGYANTILGGFGQNMVFYPEREFGLRVDGITARRKLVATARYIGEGCRPFGYCIDHSSFCWAFDVWEEDRAVYPTSDIAPCVTVGATVSGYGAALPWVGGDIYLGFLCDEHHQFDCGEYMLCDLLNEDIQCSGRLWGCNRWIGYQQMNSVEGGLEFQLEAQWMRRLCNCSSCSDKCLCLPVGCWCDNYPSKMVLASAYRQFVRDVRLYFQLADRQQQWYDCGDYEGVHELRGVSCISVGVPDTDCGRDEHWLKKFVQKEMTRLYKFCLLRLAYRTAGFWHHSCQRAAGELPEGVVRVRKFPVTECDIFCKGNASLLDNRPVECWLNELNDPDKIFTCGYIARKIVFGVPAGEPWWNVAPVGAWFQTLDGSSSCWYQDLQEERFKVGSCSRYREVRGWRIGYRQDFGDFHSVYGRWEPYYMPVRHHITKRGQFGLVNWKGHYGKIADGQ